MEIVPYSYVGEESSNYIFKTERDRTTKFDKYHQMSAQLNLPDINENRKTRCGT